MSRESVGMVWALGENEFRSLLTIKWKVMRGIQRLDWIDVLKVALSSRGTKARKEWRTQVHMCVLEFD